MRLLLSFNFNEDKLHFNPSSPPDIHTMLLLTVLKVQCSHILICIQFGLVNSLKTEIMPLASILEPSLDQWTLLTTEFSAHKSNPQWTLLLGDLGDEFWYTGSLECGFPDIVNGNTALFLDAITLPFNLALGREFRSHCIRLVDRYIEE